MERSSDYEAALKYLEHIASTISQHETLEEALESTDYDTWGNENIIQAFLAGIEFNKAKTESGK